MVLALAAVAWLAPRRGLPREADVRGRHSRHRRARSVLVVSSGGVGTTHVMTVLRQRSAAGALPPLTTNEMADNDDLKHARRCRAYEQRLLRGLCDAGGGQWRSCPRPFIGKPDAVLLLFAHPALATASIFRRRLARRMWVAFHDGEVDAPAPAWALGSDLAAYAAAVCSERRELLGVGDHFDSWTGVVAPPGVSRWDVPLLAVSTDTLARAGAAATSQMQPGGDGADKAAGEGDEPVADWEPLQAEAMSSLVASLRVVLGASNVSVLRLLAALRIRRRTPAPLADGGITAAAGMPAPPATAAMSLPACYSEVMEELWRRWQRWDGALTSV